MPGQQITINSRKYDQSIRRTWTCELIERNDPLIVVVGEFDRDVEHPGLGSISRGTVSYEYYWLDRWYNIFRFHEPDGALRNYYCNVAMPPTLDNGVLDYVDLDIDIVVWPDNKSGPGLAAPRFRRWAMMRAQAPVAIQAGFRLWRLLMRARCRRLLPRREPLEPAPYALPQSRPPRLQARRPKTLVQQVRGVP